jgi:hypothetical protein
MSHNRDLSAAAAQLGFHSSNIGIGSEAPRYPLDIHGGNLLVSGSAAGNLILEDRGVGDSSRPFALLASNDGNFTITSANRNVSGTTTSSAERLRITSAGDMGLGSSSPNHYNNYTTLTINGASGGELDFESGGTLLADTFANSGGYYFTTRTAIPIRFHTTNSGGTHAERLQLTANGLLGINHASAAQIGKVLTIRPADGDGIQFIRPGDTASNPNVHLNLTTTTSGSAYPSGEAYSVKFNTYNNDQIFETYEGGGTGGNVVFKTAAQNGTPSDRIVIDKDGTLLVNAAIDNTGGHGQIVAHAPTSGDTIYKAIEIGNTNGNGTARGAAICGQPKSNSHLPYTLIGSWDHGDDTDVYYGGGWGGAMRPATRHRFYTNSSYPTTGTSGTEVIRITSDGDLGVNTLDPQEKLHVHIAKSAGTTSTTRTKQHAAMRLSLSRNGGSAPYYGWGPALDFYSDNYDGTTQRPNARIAGVISNSSVDQEGGQLRFYTTANDTATSETDFTERMRIYADGIVTTSYQPAFFVYRNQSAWSLAANDVFVFNTAELNVGGHYNTSNGRFTAPITGRYVFHFFSIYTGDANSDSIEMYKNGSRMYGGDVHFTNSIGSAWDCVHYSRVIQLSSGDYVHMQTRTGHTFHGNHWGGWSGYMLG